MSEKLAIPLICTSGGTQARAQTNWLTVEDYAQEMRNGSQFPPVVVFFDGSTHWLADGFHRVAAAEQAGVEEIDADIRRGEKRDAILYACGANASHGARRTNADKRRAVMTLLEDETWQKWSDSEIARKCAVSQPFVSGLRPQEPTYNGYKSEPRKGADGRTINTANIGRREPASVAVIERDPPSVQMAKDWGGYPEEYAQYDKYEDDEDFDNQPESKPAFVPATSAINIINGDAQQVGELIARPVQLVVTSPPYNVGIEYDEHSDNLANYLPLLGNVWQGCYDIMEDGARICVVVPFGIGRNPYVPFDSQIMTSLQDAGFTIRGRIVWDKNTTGNRTSWGSFRMASSPALRDTTECIIVAHKGSGTLHIPAEHRYSDEKGTFTPWLADSDYFMELAQDHWVIAPESAQRVGHPAPFPVELVQRLIHFYAYPTAHIVDPFGGSGTTGIAARMNGCDATLIELSEDYCALAERRINGY